MIQELCRGVRWAAHPKGVYVTGATVIGPLDLSYAGSLVPLRMQGCSLLGDMTLRGGRCSTIELLDCQVDGGLDACFLDADHVVLSRSSINGFVQFSGATIRSNLELQETRITATDDAGHAFDAEWSQIGSSMVLDSLQAAGRLKLRGASIQGHLILNDAAITGTDSDCNAFVAEDLVVRGGFFMDRLKAAGAIRVVGATIDGDFEAPDVTIAPGNTQGEALAAYRLRVGGSAILNRVQAAGSVRLDGANIAGQLAVVGAKITVIRTEAPEPVRWNLRGARCAELADDRATSPTGGTLVLRGFRFDSLESDAGWQRRMAWVRRQGTQDWSPDPYEQLATYYTSTGDEDAARRLRIARCDDELTHLKTADPQGTLAYRTWRRPLGWLVGYGYRRHRAGWALVATILAAGLLFNVAHDRGAMVPNVEPPTANEPCGRSHECFNAWIYGTDVVLPIIDFWSCQGLVDT